MLDTQTLSQLSLLFAGDKADALALCRLIARAALDNLRSEVAATARARGDERRARHDVAKWALGDEAGDTRAVARLADALLHLLRGTLYTDAEREAAREAGRTRGHLVAVHRTVHPFVRGAASLRPRVTEVTLREAG